MSKDRPIYCPLIGEWCKNKHHRNCCGSGCYSSLKILKKEQEKLGGQITSSDDGQTLKLRFADNITGISKIILISEGQKKGPFESSRVLGY